MQLVCHKISGEDDLEWQLKVAPVLTNARIINADAEPVQEEEDQTDEPQQEQDVQQETPMEDPPGFDDQPNDEGDAPPNFDDDDFVLA